jgi:hypothetical protein
MQITDFLIERVINEDIELVDKFYKESIFIDDEMVETFGDVYPEFMEMQRPKQTASSTEYRKAYFERMGNPISGFLGAIEKQVDKVFSSEEFKVIYSDNSDLKDPKDRAEWYFKNGYYNGEDLIKSFEATIKRKLLLEANSVLAVIPNETLDGDYPKPYHVIIPAKNVIYYKANEIAILLSETRVDMYNPDGSLYVKEYGKVYYIFDNKRYVKVTQYGIKEDGSVDWRINKVGDNYRLHGNDFMPVKKLGRNIIKQTEDGHELRSTDLQGSLVFLRQAIFAFLDYTVELNVHSSSILWSKGFVSCSSCKGKGKILSFDKEANKATHDDCGSCGGSGLRSPFTGDNKEVIIIPNSVSNLGEQEKVGGNVMGYVTRDHKPAEILANAYSEQMLLALRPFGLENLVQSPYNQSGESKVYDIQEGLAFIKGMSNHIGSLLNMNVTAIVNSRYRSLTNEQRAKEVVKVVTPASFNLATLKSIFEKVKDAITYKFPDIMVIEFQRQLMEKEFGMSSVEYRKFTIKAMLDPIPAADYSRKVISRSFLPDYLYILTSNFDYLMNLCILDRPNFIYLDFPTQRTLLENKAREMAIEAADNIAAEFSVKQPTNLIIDSNN